MFEKLIKRIYRHGARRPDRPEIRVRDDGFDIIRRSETDISIALETIREISAFKRDMVTTDLVCLEIAVIVGTTCSVYELNEEMLGFDKLVQLLGKLPRFLTTWRELVIKPPFSPRRTVIYRATNAPTGALERPNGAPR
jgi:hypothetical protein